MSTVLKRFVSWLSEGTVLPVDYYTALNLDQDACEADIHAAYDVTLALVTASPWARFVGFVCGRSPARLQCARDELCDPLQRSNYDKHLDLQRALFKYPPQS
jgi:hypothetical protein